MSTDNNILPPVHVHNAEIFRPVPNQEGYYVGTEGSVLSGRSLNGRSKFVESSQRLHRLKPGCNRAGYPIVGLRDERGKHGQKTVRIHRLVLEAFVGPCPPGMLGCHNDGNPTNNRLDNLRWDTPKSNARDSVLHGTAAFGSNNGQSKLTEDQIYEILKMRAERTKLYVIAKHFGVCLATIYKICKGDGWKHFFGEREVPRQKPRIPEATKAEARLLRSQGLTVNDIAVRLGISECSVSTICSGKTYKKRRFP